MMRAMRFALVMTLALAACGGGAAMQTITFVNKTPRPIAELYIYPAGAAAHGASRGGLAPNGTTKIDVKAGNVEVLAVGAKVDIDEHTRDVPTASSAIELRVPTQVIFFDAAQRPAEVDKPNTIGVAFTLTSARNAAPQPSDPGSKQPAAPAPNE
jgi:hypothetical protein